jgi:hypothetical protein
MFRVWGSRRLEGGGLQGLVITFIQFCESHEKNNYT